MPYPYRKRSPTFVLGCVLGGAAVVTLLYMAVDSVRMIAGW